MRHGLTKGQRALMAEVERYGSVMPRGYMRRKRRMIERLVQKGVLRYSAMRNGWVTTAEWDRAEGVVEQAERVLWAK